VRVTSRCNLEKLSCAARTSPAMGIQTCPEPCQR